MVSPELLRRYTFFGPLKDDQFSAIALITDEIKVASGSTIFEEGQEANNFYLLMDGSVDLTYKSEEEYHPKTKRVFSVGEVNPGEVFGISALLDPYRFNASAHASKDSRVLIIDAAGLRSLMNANTALGFTLMQQVAKATMERLTYTRVQLAAAWG
jgi:CRP-like cAMP-binding protein